MILLKAFYRFEMMNWKKLTYITVLIYSFFLTGEINGQDLTPPEKPVITYVTVDTATGNTLVFWEKSPSFDVAGYILYSEENQGGCWQGQILDTVSTSITSYIHNAAALAGKQSILYSVTAFDTAGNQSLRKPVLCKIEGLHSTIHNALVYDSCANTITLHWNKYLGWGNSISAYRVKMKIGSGSFEAIAGIDPSDTSFVVYGIPENTMYSFLVEAVNYNTLVSASNIASKFTFMPPPPDELLLNSVKVTGPYTVDIQFSYSEGSPITDFALLRSNQEFSEFEPVKTVRGINSSPAVIQDSVFTSINKYYYRVAAVNTCRSVIGSSNLGVNMLLQGENSEETVYLEWNIYQEFPQGIEKYEVYRLDTAGNSVLLGSVINQNSYIDNLSSIYGQNYSGKIVYRIVAYEKNSGNYSISNLCEIKIKSEIWTPNAFTPNGDGKNDFFAPVLSVIPDDFLMLIYDRFGIVVFRSENPDYGWDGRINGNNLAQEGVYIYHVQISSFNGQRLNKTGHITVFYP